MTDEVVHFIGSIAMTVCGTKNQTEAITVSSKQITCPNCLTLIHEGEWRS